MTTYTTYTVNNIGIAEIAEFLKNNHKKGDIISESKDMLNAWAAEAEFQIAEGNPASIEIRSFDSVHGRTQEFTISDDGLDAIENEE